MLQREGEGCKYLPNIIQMITEVVLVGRCPDRLEGKGKKGDDFQSLDMSSWVDGGALY